jgi:hypothetical protein
VIGLGGFGFTLFLAVLFVMDIMDGRQDGANASTIAIGIAAATCLALAVWSVLCSFGGAWRARWIAAGVVLSVMAGAVGYADNNIRTAAAAEARAAKALELDRVRAVARAEQERLRQSLEDTAKPPPGLSRCRNLPNRSTLWNCRPSAVSANSSNRYPLPR